MKRIGTALIACVLLFGSAWGFDGRRKGFILGGGLGLDMCFYKMKLTDTFYVSETFQSSARNLGIAGSFKIGFAPTNQLEIVYSNRASLIASNNAVLYEASLFSLNTIGANLYFRKNGPSPFITAGCGLAALTYLSEIDERMWTGFGLHLGAGYEISKHWAIVVDLIYGTPKEKWAFGDESYSRHYQIGMIRVSMMATAF